MANLHLHHISLIVYVVTLCSFCCLCLLFMSLPLCMVFWHLCGNCYIRKAGDPGEVERGGITSKTLNQKSHTTVQIMESTEVVRNQENINKNKQVKFYPFIEYSYNNSSYYKYFCRSWCPRNYPNC